MPNTDGSSSEDQGLSKKRMRMGAKTGAGSAERAKRDSSQPSPAALVSGQAEPVADGSGSDEQAPGTQGLPRVDRQLKDQFVKQLAATVRAEGKQYTDMLVRHFFSKFQSSHKAARKVRWPACESLKKRVREARDEPRTGSSVPIPAGAANGQLLPRQKAKTQKIKKFTLWPK